MYKTVKDSLTLKMPLWYLRPSCECLRDLEDNFWTLSENMLFKKKDEKDREYFETLGNMSVVGIHLVTCTFVGFAMGYYLDKWLGTGPWCLLTFLFLGIGAGFKNMYLEVKKLQDQDKKHG